MCAATPDMPRDEEPRKIWANPEQGTCRPVGQGVWASDTLYIRFDLHAAELTAAQAIIAELTAANQALVAQMGAAVDAAVRQEREACAAIADAITGWQGHPHQSNMDYGPECLSEDCRRHPRPLGSHAMSEFESQFRLAFVIIIVGAVVATIIAVEVITWVFS